jgi:hypothetical protein
MLPIGFLNLLTLALQLLNGFPPINGIPDDHGIRHKVQAGRLSELIIRVALANLRFVGDEEITAQSVQRFALVEW